jgi:predicted membrane GTPase involved in stress response
LFVDLEAEDEVLEYPVYYASAKNFWAVKKKEGTFNINNI